MVTFPPDPLASKAGCDVLQQQQHRPDAAVAVRACFRLVEPVQRIAVSASCSADASDQGADRLRRPRRRGHLGQRRCAGSAPTRAAPLPSARAGGRVDRRARRGADARAGAPREQPPRMEEGAEQPAIRPATNSFPIGAGSPRSRRGRRHRPRPTRGRHHLLQRVGSPKALRRAPDDPGLCEQPLAAIADTSADALYTTIAQAIVDEIAVTTNAVTGAAITRQRRSPTSPPTSPAASRCPAHVRAYSVSSMSPPS